MKDGNFGDDLNEVLWDDLIPDLQSILSREAISGVGTLLGDHVPSSVDAVDKVHVLGSGAYMSVAKGWLDTKKIHFHFVRGPLSAKILGGGC